MVCVDDRNVKYMKNVINIKYNQKGGQRNEKETNDRFGSGCGYDSRMSVRVWRFIGFIIEWYVRRYFRFIR